MRAEPRKDSPYYALLPDHVPMETKGRDGGFTLRSVADEGEDVPRTQWAFALMEYLKADGRMVVDLTLSAQGRNGVLELNLSNPWRATESDGLPVTTSLVFDDRGTEQKRRIVFEPVAWGEAPRGPGQFRCTALWKPRPGNSGCEATITAAGLELK